MRVLSGIKPSGTIHLGNYLGAIRNWVAEQHEGAFYVVVDLHALTEPFDPAELNRQTFETAASLLAAGLDPGRCTVFVQSHVPYHTQLNWLLECVVSYGELRRMTQFKEKADRQGAYRAGLLTYPVLMAADILLYDIDAVPVGDDQRQHLELTREIAQRFNNRYGETFTVPEAIVPPAGARVMDLQDPSRKMSKSLASAGTIGLLDSPEEISRKVKRAVTDTDGDVRFDRKAKPGLSNLIDIMAAVSGQSVDQVCAKYERYGDLKSDLADALVDLLTPIAGRFREISADRAETMRQLQIGATRADAIAAAAFERARTAMGLLA
jgi:tryptophanyl-tRNA synthetase